MRCIFKMFKRICISNLFWNTILVSMGDASVDITVPSAGNCDDDTILICNSTVELESTGWFGLGRSLLINGAVVRPEDSNKYSQTVSGKTFSLIIKNTDITDEGEYSCHVGFTESIRTLLRVECRVKYVNLSVTRDKTIVIALDKIYPQPQIKVEILDLKNGTEITMSGTFTKKCSSSNSWLDCVWTSSSIFLDGNYSYNATITTITTSTYTGYFRIKTPDSIDVSPNATIYRIEENRLMNDVTCSADCAPVCQYAWRSDRGININDSNVLSLGEVDRTADGMYTCIARNWFGQVEMSIILAIMYGPENIVFTPSDTEYTKTEGEAMENIRCSVTCNHNCSVNWHKADTLVSNTGNLALKTIQRDDIGMYQCVATNNDIPGNPSVQRSIDINVRYGPDTVVLSSGSDISLVTGTFSPNITCSADCNPPCSFTWRNMTNNSVQSHGHIFSFGIAELAFQGEYRCTVTNNATGKSIYTTLTVTVESAELAEKGTSIGAKVGGAVGAVVLVCLIVTATVLFYRKRKQNVSENTKEHKNDVYDQLDVTATVSENTTGQNNEETKGGSPDTAYEELRGRNDRKNDVYNQLEVAATVSENTKEQKNEEIKGGSLDTAYEELRDRNDRKNDEYDQLDVAVTDISVHYENTPGQ